MGAHLSPLGEAILISTHNVGFYEEVTKIIFQLSSNTQLISFSDTSCFYLQNVEPLANLCDREGRLVSHLLKK